MKNVKIPVVKNRIDPNARQRRAHLRNWVVVLSALILMISYVWMRIEISATSREILRLEADRRDLQRETQELLDTEARLSRFDRIQNLATTQLGMVVVPLHEIKEIPK